MDRVFTEKVGTPIKMDTVEPDMVRTDRGWINVNDLPNVEPADDAPLPAMSGIARLEARIEGLEAMVKRIAAHLGIE